VPAAQRLQLVPLAPAGRYWPAPQAPQLALPVALAKVPALHSKHAPAPVAALKLPASHGVQAVMGAAAPAP
jgi:hypothetical protein